MGIVESVYNKINNLPVTQGMLALCSIICALILISKIVKTYQESVQDGQIDIKSFFKLISNYMYFLLAIVIAPVAFTLIEQALGSISDELISQHQGAINLDFTDSLKNFADQKAQELEGKGILEATLMSVFIQFEIVLYELILYITKLIYYIFMASRYLYLIILKIAAPIAIVCSLSESTMDITKTYLRNLFNCYIMLPCFLIANNFSDSLMAELSSHIYGVGQHNITFLILGLILKLFLFGKAFQYSKQLI